MLKTGFKAFGATFLGFGILLWLAMSLTGSNNIEGFARIKNMIASHSILLTVFRMTLLFLLYYYWDLVCQWFVKIKNLDQEVLEYLIQSRNDIMLWMIVVEIFIIQNLIGWLLEQYIL